VKNLTAARQDERTKFDSFLQSVFETTTNSLRWIAESLSKFHSEFEDAPDASNTSSMDGVLSLLNDLTASLSRRSSERDGSTAHTDDRAIQESWQSASSLLRNVMDALSDKFPDAIERLIFDVRMVAKERQEARATAIQLLDEVRRLRVNHAGVRRHAAADGNVLLVPFYECGMSVASCDGADSVQGDSKTS